MTKASKKSRPDPSREELAHLLLPLSTTIQINDAEAQNIDDAVTWALRRKRKLSIDEILTPEWLKALHYRMFGNVWDWAGEYRQIETNIGINWWLIDGEVRDLIENVKFWLNDGTPDAYGADEIAVRFSHQIVKIHPFANGNGRWSRLLGDILIINLGKSAFSWGGSSLQSDGALRKEYIHALIVASNDFDYRRLLHFVRS